MQKVSIVAILLVFTAVQGLMVDDLKVSQEPKTEEQVRDETEKQAQPQLPLSEQSPFPQWSLRQAKPDGTVKKVVKKRKTAPPTPPPTKAPVPPMIETMSAQWMDYHAANPTAASLRNAVREIICSMYDTEWCTNGEDYWAEVDAAAAAGDKTAHFIQHQGGHDDDDHLLSPADLVKMPHRSHDELVKLAQAQVQKLKLAQGQLESLEDGKPHLKEEAQVQMQANTQSVQHTEELDEKAQAIIEKAKQKQAQKLDNWRAQQQLKREKQESREQMKNARRAAQQQLKKEMKEAHQQAKMDEKAAMQQAQKEETQIPGSMADFENDDGEGII